jgi:RNA polymerase sigma-70 factor (ECF subfamily)
MAEIATGDRDEALDLVQDAMLRFVRHYGAREAGEWGPLFHRVLQNRIRDWFRYTQVRSRWIRWFGRGSGDDEAEDPIEAVPDTTTPNPGEQVAQDQFGRALQAALHELPLRQQQAFLLRVWEGLDVAETARVMACSEGSVKTHYSRAIHALRGRLKGGWQ